MERGQKGSFSSDGTYQGNWEYLQVSAYLTLNVMDKLQIGPTALMRKKFRNINCRPRSYIHVIEAGEIQSRALIFGALPTSETPPLRMVAEASPLRHRRGLTC